MSHQQWLRDKLFDLASEVDNGCIVELGAYRGAGTIILARGARVGHGAHVYTVDDYTAIGKWNREFYGRDNKEIFRNNIKNAKVEVQLIDKTFDAAALDWHEPIGMLYWDAGAKGRFWHDWIAWYRHIVRGGVAVIKDISSGDLGATKRMENIVASGLFEEEDYVGGVTILRRL